MFQNITSFSLILYLIVLLLVVILLTLLALLIYSGVFQTLDEVGTGKPPIGQTVIAYRFLKGPYNEAGQTFTEAAVINPGNKALGIYYDDPKKVSSENLRYVVGSILSEGGGQIEEEEVKRFTEEGFKILHLPEVTYAVRTKFPHQTSLSILIAIFKAYPLLREYIEDHKLCAYPFIEYYDGKDIHFMAPLSRQEEFFVPEFEQEAVGDNTGVDFETTLNTSHSTFGEDQETSHGGRSAEDSQDPVTAHVAINPTLNVSQNSSLPDCALQEEDCKNSESKEGDSKCSQDACKDSGSTEGSEQAEDEQTLSDGSTSSFEVVKSDPAEF